VNETIVAKKATRKMHAGILVVRFIMILFAVIMEYHFFDPRGNLLTDSFLQKSHHNKSNELRIDYVSIVARN
jgi:hypothetical protein